MFSYKIILCYPRNHNSKKHIGKKYKNRFCCYHQQLKNITILSKFIEFNPNMSNEQNNALYQSYRVVALPKKVKDIYIAVN